MANHDMTVLCISKRIGYGLNKLPWLAYVEWVRSLPERN